MTHGWPGSFMEFLPLFKLLKEKYTPETLPIHLICPSMVGFGFSAPPPRHDMFTNHDTATMWDSLMTGLGFESYVAQGGDVGSHVSRLLGERFDRCKGRLERWTWL
jgi:microsomal epoxide hydrolase